MNEFIKTPASAASIAGRKLVYGFGVNDSSYNVTAVIDGKRVVYHTYSRWVNVLERCYSKSHLEKHPSYIGCYVCDQWLTFSGFVGWFEDNYIEGYQLDKDIKVKGNRMYSPGTCLFLPSEINTLLIADRINSGKHPTGVSFDKGNNKFRSTISIDGKTKQLGRFLTSKQAVEIYTEAKNKEIQRKIDKYPEFAKYLVNHLVVI